jgi:hypothetical protein
MYRGNGCTERNHDFVVFPWKTKNKLLISNKPKLVKNQLHIFGIYFPVMVDRITGVINAATPFRA